MFSQTIQPYLSQAFAQMFGMFGGFGAPGGMMATPAGQPAQSPLGGGQPSVAPPGSRQVSDEEMEAIFNDE
jgi:hypothetical protein